jgi:twitching motility two-component system response regulator PilG
MKLEPNFQDSPVTSSDLLAYLEGNVPEIIKAAVGLAQANKKLEAKRIFLYVASAEPNNETVWLWLASLSEYPEELLCFLENVLRINPNNQKALEWKKNTHHLLAKTFIQRGITAYREEKKNLAKLFFEEAVKNDRSNEIAWLWLASVVEDVKQKQAFLEEVLKINPNNETARNSLNSINQQFAHSLLKKANAAFISGKITEARHILEELMNFNSEIEEAWLLKAYLSISLNEKRVCFEKVLNLNPKNEIAKTGLEALKEIEQSEQEEAEKQKEISSEESKQENKPLEAQDGLPTAAEEFDKSAQPEQLLTPTQAEAISEEKTTILELPKTPEQRDLEAEKEEILAEHVGSENQPEIMQSNISESAEQTSLESQASDSQKLDSQKDSTSAAPDQSKTELEESASEASTVSSDDLKAEKESEFTESVAEEIESESLSERLAEVLPKSEAEEAAIKQEAELQEANLQKAESKKVILVVDDSPTIRKLISVKLEKSGYEVMQANDGIEALAIINQIIPDLILLDVTMPNLDGYQVCQMIRSNESTKHVPVIIISGKDGFFDKVRGQMAGSTGYITKPFGPETLMNTIKTYLRD